MSDAPRLTIHVDLADELEEAGLVETRTDSLQKAFGGDVAGVSLLVFNVMTSTITLMQGPDAVRKFASALAARFRRAPEDERPYQMRASGPKGTFDFQSDDPPDDEAVLNFLHKNVWGEDDRA